MRTAGFISVRFNGKEAFGKRAFLSYSNDLFNAQISCTPSGFQTWWVVNKASIKYFKKNQSSGLDCLYPKTKHLWYMSILNFGCVEKSCSWIWTLTLTDARTNTPFFLLKTAASVVTVQKNPFSEEESLISLSKASSRPLSSRRNELICMPRLRSH